MAWYVKPQCLKPQAEMAYLAMPCLNSKRAMHAEKAQLARSFVLMLLCVVFSRLGL